MYEEKLKINRKLLEGALLFTLLLNTLRTFHLTNQTVLLVLAVLTILFFLLSLPRLRLIVAFIIILVTLLSILFIEVRTRAERPGVSYIHDGTVITEEAYKGLMRGQNPYSMSFDEAFKRNFYYLENIEHHEEIHYTYSPLMFLVNTPILTISQIFGVLDARIGALLFLFATALVGLTMVKEKTLFLITFLLNPLFLHSVFDGANEVFILFFILAAVTFILQKKVSMATIMLGLATSTKLLSLPFVPLYFLFIWMKVFKKRLGSNLLKQIGIFIAVNFLVYLPFVVWNLHDLLDDIIFYHIQGGNSGRPIAGFLGMPQLLVSAGIIDKQNQFPFFIFMFPLSLIFFIFAYRILQKRLDLPTLCLLFASYFILAFSLSRIIQTDYLTFISQILLFGSFISKNNKR